MGNAALYSTPFHPTTGFVALGSKFTAESAVVKNASFSSRQGLQNTHPKFNFLISHIRKSDKYSNMRRSYWIYAIVLLGAVSYHGLLFIE